MTPHSKPNSVVKCEYTGRMPNVTDQQKFMKRAKWMRRQCKSPIMRVWRRFSSKSSAPRFGKQTMLRCLPQAGHCKASTLISTALTNESEIAKKRDSIANTHPPIAAKRHTNKGTNWPHKISPVLSKSLESN